MSIFFVSAFFVSGLLCFVSAFTVLRRGNRKAGNYYQAVLQHFGLSENGIGTHGLCIAQDKTYSRLINPRLVVFTATPHLVATIKPIRLGVPHYILTRHTPGANLVTAIFRPFGITRNKVLLGDPAVDRAITLFTDNNEASVACQSKIFTNRVLLALRAVVVKSFSGSIECSGNELRYASVRLPTSKKEADAMIAAIELIKILAEVMNYWLSEEKLITLMCYSRL